MTALCNVPLNDALAVVDPGSARAAWAMAGYLRDWSQLNHVRTVCALGATALLLWSFGRREADAA